jgi:hypothetical protein
MTFMELLARGDVAASSADHRELERIAILLSSRVGDPLAGECERLAHRCHSRRPHAHEAWPSLRAAIAHRASIAGT